MQRSLFGVLIGSFLVIGATAYTGFTEPVPAPVHDVAAAGLHPRIQTHVTSVDAHTQMVIVVDTEQRTMAVYYVDRATGEITLKSVRNMTWDLQMTEFNTGEPLPQDIRNMRRGVQP